MFPVIEALEFFLVKKADETSKKGKGLFEKSWFVMPYELEAIPLDDDIGIRFPESFVEKFLLEFTKEGDRVFDPFAGFGTTLIVAQRLKRIGIGIEYDEKRFQHIQGKTEKPTTIIHGDSLKLDTYDIAPCDFSITSPPYMQFYHEENPFTNYTKEGNYERYLSDIRTIYAQIKRVMKKDAMIVLEVSNIFGDGKPMTPLAWDIARELSKELFFEREFIYCHENGTLKPNTGSHSYCLLFRNK